MAHQVGPSLYGHRCNKHRWEGRPGMDLYLANSRLVSALQEGLELEPLPALASCPAWQLQLPDTPDFIFS